MSARLGHVLPVAVLLAACHGERSTFERLGAERTGIHFLNRLQPTEDLNTYLFRNYYNGGGVAIGDVDADGLADIFLTGNQVSNRLYRNTGGVRFEDVTERSGLLSRGIWSTGASMADVNGDGYLDIYVCKSGPPGGERRHNELFVNDGDGTFTERAAEYGLDVAGLSIHATFFDYDGDADLDMYLLSNPIRSLDDLRRRPGLRHMHDPDGGNKLFRNEFADIGHVAEWTDVTEEAGLFGSAIGFGLGVSVSDLNRDGWPDMYVSNDFFERDYLYVNRWDGTFEEELPAWTGTVSLSSMGGDIADLNHDGYPEIFVSDMLPRAARRLQSKIAFESYEEVTHVVDDGYHYQYTRNTLQLNRGPSARFSEIGRMAGVEATDWSWGGLLADFDLDGSRDLFVPNGIFKDLLDQDFIARVSDRDSLRAVFLNEDEPIMALLSYLPSEPVPNVMFRGDAALTYQDVSAAWGFSEPSFSNGSAYGDLDNDGDLDLVVSNVNMESFVYLNHSTALHTDRHWLQVELVGDAPNSNAVGGAADGVGHRPAVVPRAAAGTWVSVVGGSGAAFRLWHSGEGAPD